MCQLCFINLNNKVLNRTWAYASIYANSKETHEDGFGISSGNLVYKHTKCAWNLTDWTKYVKFISNKPVMTHVRKASLVRGRRLVGEMKYTHPFRTKNLILIHNGTLLRKDVNNFSQYKLEDMVDSEIFLKVLSSIYNKNGHKLELALQKTMEDFYGKFAFVIYETMKDKYTIVRGKTALLHYLSLNVKKDNEEAPAGFIVNTEKDSLYDSLCIANNSLINSHSVEISWEKEGETEILEPESIYEIEKFKIKKVGEIKENSEPVVTHTYSRGHSYNNNLVSQSFNAENLRIAREMFSFKNKWRISLEYLDLLIYFTFGTGILTCKQEDFVLFIDKIIPKLNKFAKDEEDFLVKIWKEIREDKALGDISLTKKFKLPFPYFVVDKAEDLYSYLDTDTGATTKAGEAT